MNLELCKLPFKISKKIQQEPSPCSNIVSIVQFPWYKYFKARTRFESLWKEQQTGVQWLYFVINLKCISTKDFII